MDLDAFGFLLNRCCDSFGSLCFRNLRIGNFDYPDRAAARNDLLDIPPSERIVFYLLCIFLLSFLAPFRFLFNGHSRRRNRPDNLFNLVYRF